MGVGGGGGGEKETVFDQYATMMDPLETFQLRV